MNIEINSQIVRHLGIIIMAEERQNLKKLKEKQNKDNIMIERFRKIVEEEVRKNAD